MPTLTTTPECPTFVVTESAQHKIARLEAELAMARETARARADYIIALAGRRTRTAAP